MIVALTLTRAFVAIVCLFVNACLAAAAAPDKAQNVNSQVSEIADAPGPILYLTIMLTRDTAVQSELGLSAGQIETIEKAAAEVDLPLWQLRDVSPRNASDTADSLRSKFQERLTASLTSAQQDRLNQMVVQASGLKAFSSREVVQRLGLSTAKIKQVRDIAQQVEKDVERSNKDNGDKAFAERARLRAKLQATGQKKILDAMIVAQRSEYAKLVGKPFDLSRVRQVACIAPELREVDGWINTESLTLRELRGKVVVVHFWAFGCINCIRNLPHYQAWYERFPPQQVTIVGIHTPETESERSLDNLRRKVEEYKISYPVAFDAKSENWKAWANSMWPSVYLIDKQGHVRQWWYGELNWQGANGEESMRGKIQELIDEK